ncbi:MAG: Gx transporter family protein [Rhodocyclaceae bacterium]|nr:Gx transporter family protein [Rhodocyclaceae bacterium]
MTPPHACPPPPEPAPPEPWRLVQPTEIDRRIARHAAAAIALTLAEAAIPSPLPGIKPGLANIITLVVAVRWGWREAVWVNLLRVLAGSLLLGNFLAPGFFLSLAGSLASLAMLGLTLRLPPRWFGPVTHSVAAAFAHIAGQLLLARLWLVPHDGVFLLAPLFACAALLFGLANGLAAARLLQPPARQAGQPRYDVPT